MGIEATEPLSEDLSREPLAVVAGVRTPFAKVFGRLAHVPADELGRIVVEETLRRAALKPEQVDEVIFGNVAGPAEASNVARVIALRAGIPKTCIAHTVNRNCASGMESIVTAWQAIAEGRAQIVVAGGTESMSNVPLLWNRQATQWLIQLRRQRNLWSRVKHLARFRPGFLKPVVALQLGLTDPTCGMIMGQTAEVLAHDFAISREEQDRFALLSHQRARAAQQSYFLSGEIAALPAELADGRSLEHDDGPRPGQTLEALARLKPFFEAGSGTVTVGNSCQVTDGGAALVVMSASRARAMGCAPLGYVRAYAIAGCDPSRMGLGPVFAIAKLLDNTGLFLKDLDLIEINEAFAVQVLACMRAMASNAFAQQQLGRSDALGELAPERLNVNGGAIALGHPVGASGTRLVLTLLRALRERRLKQGLAALCVGGGQGMAILVETARD